jgi:hypothetical protein
MALQEQYGGATARDCAAEMCAQEVAEALVMKAQGPTVRVPGAAPRCWPSWPTAVPSA